MLSSSLGRKASVSASKIKDSSVGYSRGPVSKLIQPLLQCIQGKHLALKAGRWLLNTNFCIIPADPSMTPSMACWLVYQQAWPLYLLTVANTHNMSTKHHSLVTSFCHAGFSIYTDG